MYPAFRPAERSDRTLYRGLLLLTVFMASLVRADFSGKATDVTSGDTVVATSSSGGTYTVRLAGIDAPEADQPYGAASTQNLGRLVLNKDIKVVIVESSSGDELVARVYTRPHDCPTCGKTLDLGHAQVLSGMAWWRTSGGLGDENSGRYVSSQQEARLRQWGLWQDPTPINPSDWRAGVRP